MRLCPLKGEVDVKMALSDVLAEAEETISEAIERQPLDGKETARIELITNLMRAFRMTPGFDVPPGHADAFDERLEEVLEQYRQRA